MRLENEPKPLQAFFTGEKKICTKTFKPVTDGSKKWKINFQTRPKLPLAWFV
ncbi:hypothetical protein FHS68_003658 [Dyadobacter arcticus]|uniref:Uncharacterized protein n=1 Tax=Dyadobacter arcticus TaxID=1078754 RepID=A0ABX0UNE4_9BACT|nr:hypothetical protein [Dyadobacter arcticus]